MASAVDSRLAYARRNRIRSLRHSSPNPADLNQRLQQLLRPTIAKLADIFDLLELLVSRNPPVGDTVCGLKRLHAIAQHAEVGRLHESVEPGGQCCQREHSRNRIGMFARQEQHVDGEIQAFEFVYFLWLIQ